MVIELSYRASHSMRIPQNDVVIHTLPYPIKCVPKSKIFCFRNMKGMKRLLYYIRDSSSIMY